MLGSALDQNQNNNNSESRLPTRRESRKRRRVSERRRVFSRLGVTGPDLAADMTRAPAGECRQRPQRSDSQGGSPQLGGGGDQGKIAMKIQFHIVLAPDNEPLILDNLNFLNDHQKSSSPPPRPPVAVSSAQQNHQTAGQKRQISSESAISEHINERLSRQNSSTRRRQQLLAMHHQAALVDSAVDQQQQRRTGSISAGAAGGHLAPMSRGEAGLRSSTITGGMPHDEATANFLARQEQQQQQGQLQGRLRSQTSVSLGNYSPASQQQLVVGQHQTLMASSNNIRARLEGREHIYFKRDGQRFGHEFTLKLAVDKSYRCLLKVRPLLPLAAISIQGHHVSFVDCSQSSSGGSSHSLAAAAAAGPLGGSLTTLANSSSSSSASASSSSAAPRGAHPSATGGARHQSIGNLLSSPSGGLASSRAHTTNLNHRPSMPHHHHQAAHQNSDPTAAVRLHQHDQNSASLGSLSLSSNVGNHHHHQLAQQPMSVRQQMELQMVRQQQQHQMQRHFGGARAGASAGSAGQLVYMFDWSAGRFEVNKNKARTQVHTVLKFKNGEILSLPLQVKFYEPECKQHLSWGSQLHFIDYDCQINSMGQISVERVQYY